MGIYSVLIVPFAAAGIALILFPHKIKWWEAVLPLFVAMVTVVAAKAIGENMATRDSEFWGGWVITSHYFEDWDEYIHKTCSREHCTGSGKNRSCTTEFYDCSYVDYHPERWELRDSNGQTHSISKNEYNRIVDRFNMRPVFKDMRRHYHSNDGDSYWVSWDGSNSKLAPVFTLHNYENRVAASNSVFNYRYISEKEAVAKGLFSYPKVVSLLDFPSVLGNCGPETNAVNKLLQFYNARMGRDKQIRMWLLCTDSKDPGFGQDQESYWFGGNKNEVVLVKGDGWVHLFSWADNKTPLIETRNFIAEQEKWNATEAVDFMAKAMRDSFVRKEFADFSYLAVDTPFWCVALAWIITLLTNVGLCWWSVVNEYRD